MDTAHQEISVFFQAVPRSVCDAILEMGESRTPSQAEISKGEDVTEDLSFRDSEVSFLSLDSWVAGLMRHFIDLANAGKWNYPLSELQALQYAVYRVNGHFGWHQDGREVEGPESYGSDAETGASGFARRVTGVLFLSDNTEYSGGRLELRDEHGVIHTDPSFLVAGTCVVFPSHVFHRVTPVVSGIRKTLATWALGPAA
ncbi:2OG-Fe(II) oxygenase [Propionivibrio sp.]|uniref:2OG-Fe(II) oxygenase n=1 Tax=Propionivibrio sp. TaxID=2212460 RepID=UPI003BF09F55